MNYLSPCPLPADESVVSAWDSELRRIKTPWIEQILAEQGQDLFQRFTSTYNELRALPRNARRALQRKLAASEDGTIPADWRRRLAYSIAGAALLIALGQTVSEAKAPKPTNIKLSTKCTLDNALQAIYLANSSNYAYTYYGCKASPGPATIVMPKTPVSGGSGAPIISQITIQGAKAKKPKKGQPVLLGTGGTISGSFSVYDGGNLTLQNVTLHGSSGYVGGSIYVGYGGRASIFDSVISGTAQQGGALFNSGSVTLNHSNVTKSSASYGGGIYNVGNLTVTNNSTISGNHADYDGGGIYNAYSATISNSTISTNTAARNGGGIANSTIGTLSITSSTISGNQADYDGGGIDNAYNATISNSTLTGNTAYKGGALHNGYNLTVTSSTISNSTANYGGGLYNYSGTNTTLTGSTVSGNQATVFPKTPITQTYYYGGYGAGINNHGGLTLNSSTITGNTAQGKKVTYNTNTFYYGGKGGGIYNAGDVNIYTGSSVTLNKAAYYGGGLFNYLGSTYYAAPNTITGNGNPPAAPKGADIFPLPPP
ncbi:MAG TPA: right-handed parallel beta-helix repeat-containing protein [Candidatus Binatia bacterium]|jgi:hypothetical protein